MQPPDRQIELSAEQVREAILYYVEREMLDGRTEHADFISDKSFAYVYYHGAATVNLKFVDLEEAGITPLESD